MQTSAQLWLEQAATVPGILACGVRCPDQSIIAKCNDDVFVVSAIEELVRELAETILSFQINHIAPERLRWTFANAWLHCVAGADGALGVLLVTRQFEASPEIQQLLTCFLGQ